MRMCCWCWRWWQLFGQERSWRFQKRLKCSTQLCLQKTNWLLSSPGMIPVHQSYRLTFIVISYLCWLCMWTDLHPADPDCLLLVGLVLVGQDWEGGRGASKVSPAAEFPSKAGFKLIMMKLMWSGQHSAQPPFSPLSILGLVARPNQRWVESGCWSLWSWGCCWWFISILNEDSSLSLRLIILQSLVKSRPRKK